MSGIIDFVKGSYVEFKEYVTWPKWNVLQSVTIVIATATLLLSIFLYGIDTLFSELINNIYRILK